MTPIKLDVDDVLITLKAIERNKAYECRCEEQQFPCQLKQKLSVRRSAKHFMATQALLNVRNASTEPFAIDITRWELIDTDGYAYQPQALCDAIRPLKTVDLNSCQQVSSGTQVNLVLLFPELKGNAQIACLSYRSAHRKHQELYLFEISKSKRSATDLVRARELLRVDARSARVQDCKAYLVQLQQAAQSRLSKSLTRMESESQERKFQKLVQAVEETLQLIKPIDRKPLRATFDATVEEYERELEKTKKRDDERKRGNQTLENLGRLSFGDFEEFVKELFEDLGYEKVTLRGKSGDQGADILAEKNGERIAIQCKHYKGKVGTPELQGLLGAMQSTDAQRGFLVTTGMFSLPAERMAKELPIDLINSNLLIEWIAEVRAK